MLISVAQPPTDLISANFEIWHFWADITLPPTAKITCLLPKGH